MTPAWYLIIYDIRNPARLQKTHRFLRQHAYALQKSVFAWHGTTRQLLVLQKQISSRIRENEDDVRGYRISRNHDIITCGVSPILAGVFDARYPPLLHFDSFEGSPLAKEATQEQAFEARFDTTGGGRK